MITYFLKTYGCQANVADSHGVATFLDECGCQQVEQEVDADLIIINTCAIREKAEQKLFSYIGTLAPLRAEKPYQKLGVMGCVASYKKRELYGHFPHVDFVYGAREEMTMLMAYLNDVVQSIATAKQLFMTEPERYTPQTEGRDKNIQKVVERKRLLPRGTKSLPFIVRDALRAPHCERGNVFLPSNLRTSVDSLAVRGEELQGSASNHTANTRVPKEVRRSFINIMTGCNKYCTYCIVPFTRGREISFPMHEILEKVAREIELGSKEITLIGQNVNSYIDPVTSARFPELMERVAQLSGAFWVRFISPHPQDMTRDLFEVMAKYRKKLVGYLHFPLQSGSNRILQAMNRTYTAEEYLEKVGWIHELLPDATITTDIIVGFPGETEEDYQATRRVMEDVKFDLIYSFIYSRRKYTKAFSMEDNCSMQEKEARLEALQKRHIEICQERNQRLVGKQIKALVEKRLTNDKLLARTEGNVRVLFDGSDDVIGTFVTLEICEAKPVNVYGTLIL
ncbi:MAG: MiaB/RimO family radical SAM methylthiotransferase [Candidatus Babeliales bacterium]